MKEFSTANIRNIVLASHSNSGKTILVENLLNFTGATTRIGNVEDGTTVSDFDDEEKRRNISLFTSVLPVVTKTSNSTSLTPRLHRFRWRSCLRYACGRLRPDPGRFRWWSRSWHRTALDLANQFNMPKIIVINKMDRDNASYRKALDSVSNEISDRLIPVQLPWGEKADFRVSLTC